MAGRVKPGASGECAAWDFVPLGAADSKVYGVDFIAPKTLTLLALLVNMRI